MLARRALALTFVLAFPLGVTTPRPAAATVMAAVSLEELAREAALVAVLTPTADQRAHWRDGRVVTDVVCAVAGALKGRAPSTVTVRLPGGVVGDVGQRVEGAATLPPGAPAVVFLGAERDGARVVLAMSAGVLPLATIRGTVTVLPARTEGITFVPGASPAPPSRVTVPSQGLPLADFAARLREVTR